MTTEQSPVMKIIQDITQPVALENLYDESRKIRVILHRPNTNDLDIQLHQLFPFLKIYDLKLAIYKHLKDKGIATDIKTLPEYQFLSSINRIKSSGRPGTYNPIDFKWAIPGSKTPLLLAKPFDIENTKKVALDFVDENGSLRNLSLTDTSKLLLKAVKISELHLYLYDDMKGQIPSDDEPKWNAYLHPYFPALSYGLDTVDKKKAEARFQRFQNIMTLSTNLNGLLKNTDLSIRFTGVKRLQMRWDLTGSSLDAENLFYSSPVTENRPYMRLMPNKGVFITKLHLQEDNTPDADLARVLKQWSRERNPNPQDDYVMVKSVLKASEGEQDYPIYMTLRFGKSNTQSYADVIVQPPKGVRKLDTLFTETVDAGEQGRKKKFVDQFEKGIDKLPCAPLPLLLENATLIYEIQLPSKPIFTKGSLKMRLPKFLPFFQEIPPLPGDQPVAMLRYKCVDNFTNENRISSFLTQYANLKLIKGETDNAILTVLEEQFQLDTDTAQDILGRWLKNRGEFDLVDANETVEAKNTGIDIAIFARHPIFHVHLHNVSSVESLREVLTLLTILFRASDESLHVSAKVAEKIKAAEAEAVAVEVAVEAAQESVDAAPVELDEYWSEMAGQAEMPLEEEVHNEFLAAQEDLVSAPIAPLPSAAVAPLPADEDEEVGQSQVEDGKIAADFFLTRLKEADKSLFDYTKTHPSLKKYVSMCAANVTRQPAVIDKKRYEEMKDIYEEDLEAKRIAFVVYPLNKNALDKDHKIPERPENTYEEVFFFLEYGTTATKRNDNFYVCSKYFCGRDELIVLERDFKGTVLRRPVVGADGRERRTKAPNTCPFCEGKPVVNRRNPGLNETILIRQEAPKTQGGIFHKYVGFLKKSPHPEGFHFPCCFIDNTLINETDKYYDKFRDIRQTPAPLADDVAAQAQVVEIKKRDEAMFPKEAYISYMSKAFTKYIVGSEKLPLEIDEIEGPQIGLLPPVLDAYFKQDISNFINPKTPHKLKPDAEGFLRIGVENRSRFKADSFLAAIAPFYMQKSAREMKALIKESLRAQPSIFFQLNYGNFLLEYYDLQIKEPTAAELYRWLEGTDINKWSGIIAGSELESTIAKRFYISYNSFLGWLDEEDGPVKGWVEKDDTLKEYRQLASLLSQPDFILRMPNLQAVDEESQRPGITFIVLDITEDNKLEVRCPPYGYNELVHASNDIAFILHHHSGIWEPIFHVDKNGPATAIFQRGWKAGAEELGWPSVVKERADEFKTQCISDSRFAYPSKQLEKRTLINSSLLKTKMASAKIEFDGILKDPYNHLVALVFKHPVTKESVPVPCIDDGTVFPFARIYLDWDDLATAKIKDILAFYQTYITTEREFKSQQGDELYTPVQLWYEPIEGGKVRVFALALRNSSIVPIKRKQPVELITEGEMKYYQAEQFKIMAFEKNRTDLEWEVNKKLLDLTTEPKQEEGATKASTELSSNDISDIFEHLRITFAKWLSKSDGGGEIRKKLKEIIYKPRDTSDKEHLSKQRKELYAMLNGIIFSWFSTQSATGRPSIQRIDCTDPSLTQDTCSGRCVWNVDDHKCFIHTPKDKLSIEVSKDKSKIQVDIQYLLFFKLIEELLRFAGKRRELFEDRVSQIGLVDRRIQEGDQEILPENTAAWYERLRGDWVRSTEEKPKFFEEMSVAPSRELPGANVDTELPRSLAVYLGDEDVRTKSLRILRGTSAELLGLVGFTDPVELPMDATQLAAFSQRARVSVAQIDIRADPNPVAIFKHKKLETFQSPYFILVITEDGPAVLVVDPSKKQLPLAYELPRKLKEYFAIKRGGRQTRRKSRS